MSYGTVFSDSYRQDLSREARRYSHLAVSTLKVGEATSASTALGR
jgi:hypothetical protein